MNWIFLGIFEDIQSFFDEVIWSKFNTEQVSGSNAKELVRSFFEHNPIEAVDTGQINSDFLSQGIANVQNVVAEFSGGTGSLIASAPILLLAASVVIILGVVIGPVFGIIQPEAVIEIVPYFAALALIIIMFDGGYNLHIGNVLKTAHFAIVLVILGFAVSVGIVAAFGHYGLGWEWIDSILLGAIVGGSSSIIVFGLVRKLRISDEAKSMLSFESALTDIFATIIAFILFEAILSGQFNLDLLGQTIGRAVAVGLILGFGVGIPWMFFISKLTNAQHNYMLTLGVLFLLFFLANSFGESGALTALVFGLMLGNKKYLVQKLKIKLPDNTIDNSLHRQVTFIVRAFFFVFVGLLASFGQIEYVIFGILAAVAIYVGRVIITHTALVKGFSKLDKKVTSVMIPRGLAAAVLATIPLTMGLQNGEAYPQIIFFIILTSVIITTIGLGGAKKIPPPEGEGGFVTSKKEE